MEFKSKIIGFMLFLITVMMLLTMGVFGYIIYDEIFTGERIEIGVLEQNNYPNLENTNKKENEIQETLGDVFPEIKDNSNTQVQKVQSRFLYNQLDSTAKTIYDKLYNSKEMMKTGTYTLEFGNTFSKMLAKENGEEELQKHYQSAIEAFVYENPDVFYINASKMYITIETITKLFGVSYNVYINTGDNANYLANGLSTKEDVKRCEQEIDTVKNHILSLVEGKRDYEKIKIIHDYLIDNIEYETTISQSNIYNIYGALVLKRCVCEGYAKAYQYLLNEVGINNVLVIGTATNDNNQTENHAWNYVNLENNWYAIDATWDDPIIIGGGMLTNQLKYKYFLKGSVTMNTNHVVSGNFTENGMFFKYPELSITDYHF